VAVEGCVLCVLCVLAGGETMILQPKLLGNFWQTFQPGKGLELTDLVQLVESPYGQLTVFDPRLPHGVRPVSGTRDPRQVCAAAVTGAWLPARCTSKCRLTRHLTLGLHHAAQCTSNNRVPTSTRIKS